MFKAKWWDVAFSSPVFTCKFCGAKHGGAMPDPHICRECWNKGKH